MEDGVAIRESLLTVEYIEDVYPQNPLLPKDPLKRIQDKLFVKATEPVSVFLLVNTGLHERVVISHMKHIIEQLLL